MTSTRHLTARSRRAKAACLGACATFFLLCACRSATFMPSTDSRITRADAESATACRDWSRAANCWYSVFRSERCESVDACLNAVDALALSGRANTATKVIDLGLHENPECAALLLRKGELLVVQGFERAAEPIFERATQADPSSWKAWVALARVQLHLGFNGSACDSLQRAVAVGGTDFETSQLLGRALRTRDPMNAYQAYVRAFELGSGAPVDLVEAATVCLDEQVRQLHPDCLERMHDWLERAIAIDPRCKEAQFELGVACEEQDRDEEAIVHYRRALAIEPAFLPALTNLALLMVEQHRDARVVLERALAAEPDAERRRALHQMLLASDDASIATALIQAP